MHRPSIVTTACLAGALLLTVAASTARAGCVDLRAAKGHVSPAGYRTVSLGDRHDSAPIVGLWAFTFTSDIDVPPANIHAGDVLDWGFAQWHSDGTEIMNSSRDPATSNFCLGVWQQTGARSFKLNHFALSWDNTGHLCTPDPGAPSCFVGPTNIRETVTVNRSGDQYSGKVTIDQYDTANNLMLHLSGTIKARRITPN
jgi:hypothetical protein